jgi:hypothetical protein
MLNAMEERNKKPPTGLPDAVGMVSFGKNGVGDQFRQRNTHWAPVFD